MKPFTMEEKKKLLADAFWDKHIDVNQLYDLLTGKIAVVPFFDKKSIYCRLLTTYGWYTLIGLLPNESLREALADDVLERLYPKELKKKYQYARTILFT